MSSAPTGKQRQFVYSLSEYDVLLGRGQHAKQEGNLRFVSLVRSRVEEYKRANGKGNNANKDAVARQIGKDVQELGGRFVRKVEDSVATGVSECDDVWEIADLATVLVKIKQTFRDYSVIRRKAAAAAASTATATPPRAASSTTTMDLAPVAPEGDTKPPERLKPLARVESVSAATVNQPSVAHHFQLLRALEQHQRNRNTQTAFHGGMEALGELGTVARLSMPLRGSSESVVSQRPQQSTDNNLSNETLTLQLLRELQSRATAPEPAALVPTERPLEQHFYNLMQRQGHNPTTSDMPSALLFPTDTTASSLYSQPTTTMQSQIRAGTSLDAPIAAVPNSLSSNNVLRHCVINNLMQNERRQLLQRQLLLQQLNAAASSTMVPSNEATALRHWAGERLVDANVDPALFSLPLLTIRDHVGAMAANPNVSSQDFGAFCSQFLPTAASTGRPPELDDQERSRSRTNGIWSSATELDQATRRIGH